MTQTIDTVQTPAPVRTTQLHAKKLKLHLIYAFLITLIGIVWLVAGQSTAESMETATGEVPPMPVAGILLTITGVAWLLLTKFRMWWDHG